MFPHKIVPKSVRRGSLRLAAAILLAVCTLPPARAGAGLQTAGPASPSGLNAPSNIACLPFPEPTITEYNGDEVGGPYPIEATQTAISWRDESDTEMLYYVERQVNDGDWEEIGGTAADVTLFIDDELNETDEYRYRVRAWDGENYGGYSDVCQKPLFLDSSADHFRVFYRPFSADGYCPAVEDLDSNSEIMCTTQSLAETMADRLELSYAWLDDHGFTLPGVTIAVDLAPCDTNGCARSNGATRFIGLRPSTMAITFNPAVDDSEHSLRVPRHELQHLTQSGVTAGGDVKWVIEGQARSVDDKYCLDAPGCTLTLDDFPGSWYLGDVADYLANPNRTLFEVGYDSALFWTYISEKYGEDTQEPERGVDFFSEFWLTGQGNAHTHGREVIDLTLEALHPGDGFTFESVFKAFVVANYAKDLPNAPAQYTYADETQPPGPYGSVSLTVSMTLGLGDQYLGDTEDTYVVPWGARYFRFVPDAAVPTLDFHSETLTGNNVYYHLLAIKNGSIVDEISATGDSFDQSLPNDALDEVVLVVAGLDDGSNLTLAVNATQPELRIVDPIAGRPAQGGDPNTPEKFMIMVEVLSPENGGTPMAGIDPATFTVTVNGAVVPPEQVINTAYVQGEYWLLVRAPMQLGPGTFDLTVENDSVVAGATLSETEADAVVYDASIESDNLIVGDRSGSMDDYPQKLEAAQDAARLYVDSWETGDQLGVISYNEAANLDLGLQPWNTNSRDDAFEVIDDWEAGGDTGIGVALLLALDEFDEEGDSAHPWNIILLTDGIETVEDPNLEDFVAAYDALSGQKPQVHIVSLGPDADLGAMDQLASDTGGTHQHAGELPAGLQAAEAAEILNNELAEVYRVIAETIRLEQQVYAAHETLVPGPEQVHTIQVDGSASEAIFVVNYEQEGSTAFDIDLRNPLGNLVSPTRIDGGGHLFYRVSLPMQGEWTVTLEYSPPGLAAPTVEEVHYLVEAALRSDLTLQVFLGLAPEERSVGRPMPILVSLADTAPLVGATVTADVTSPTGFVHEVTFYDDGLHGDGAAGDGFYGTTFYQTSVPGAYNVVVDAAGDSPLHGDYTRRARLAFAMAGGPDSDSDGLPDPWEEDNGLDPDVFNPSNSDPDGDGLLTFTEFQIGTHPLDPDTDNGGENDGSEYFRDAIPQDYPPDDGVLPADVTGWAGAGQLWLTYTGEPNHDHIRVFRATQPTGPFTLVADNVDLPARTWHDDTVNNGTQYCYRVVAVSTGDLDSGWTETTCLTPKLDPLAPVGEVALDGAAIRGQPVLLRLRATDAPADEHNESDQMPPVGDGAQVSGVTHMQISNNGDFAGAVWEPYQTTKTWLPETNGDSATVYVRFRDRSGNISPTVANVFAVSSGTTYLPVVGR